MEEDVPDVYTQEERCFSIEKLPLGDYKAFRN